MSAFEHTDGNDITPLIKFLGFGILLIIIILCGLSAC